MTSAKCLVTGCESNNVEMSILAYWKPVIQLAPANNINHEMRGMQEFISGHYRGKFRQLSFFRMFGRIACLDKDNRIPGPRVLFIAY
jgi:hypothetical protein